MDAVPYDFWLFDLDGTIVDIEPDYPREVIGKIGARLGVGFSDREAEVLWYGMGGSRATFLRERGVSPEEFWRTFHQVEDPRARARSTYVYDDAAAFVPELDGPVGVVTHCQEYLTEPVLAHLDIADWFDVVVCCDDELGWKPAPGPVEVAMSAMGVTPTDDLGALVGDDAVDVDAARNAGLEAIHVARRDPADREECVRSDRRIRGLDELSRDDLPDGRAPRTAADD
jgi:phosphoglycolate phosphatase